MTAIQITTVHHCGGEVSSEHFLPKAENELKNLSSSVNIFFTLLYSWKHSFPQKIIFQLKITRGKISEEITISTMNNGKNITRHNKIQTKISVCLNVRQCTYSVAAIEIATDHHGRGEIFSEQFLP